MAQAPQKKTASPAPLDEPPAVEADAPGALRKDDDQVIDGSDADPSHETPWTDDEGPPSEEDPSPKTKPPQPSLVDILRARLQEKDDQLHSYIGAYKQAKEEMAKAQERLKRDQAKEVSRAKMAAARELIEVLDNLDRTMERVPKSAESVPLAEGMRMVQKQFAHALTAFGVSRMESLGAIFDPTLHEAVGMVPAPGKADQEIIFVQRAGYLFDGQLLRAAQVIIAAVQ